MNTVTITQKQGHHSARIPATGKLYMTRKQALDAAIKLLGGGSVKTEETFDVATGIATITVRRA